MPARIFGVSAVERPLYRHKPRLFSFGTWLRPNLPGTLYTFLTVFVCIFPAMDSRAAAPSPRTPQNDSCVYFRNTGSCARTVVDGVKQHFVGYVLWVKRPPGNRKGKPVQFGVVFWAQHGRPSCVRQYKQRFWSCMCSCVRDAGDRTN